MWYNFGSRYIYWIIMCYVLHVLNNCLFDVYLEFEWWVVVYYVLKLDVWLVDLMFIGYDCEAWSYARWCGHALIRCKLVLQSMTKVWVCWPNDFWLPSNDPLILNTGTGILKVQQNRIIIKENQELKTWQVNGSSGRANTIIRLS